MKKWIIIVVIALAIGGLVVYFISQGGTPEVGAPGEEKPVTSGTIQVPGGPKIKVVFVDFPEELELKWEKLGMDDFQLNLIGALKNISNQTIRFDKLIFLLDGDQIGHWPRFEGKTLGPGEEARFNMGMVGYSEASKILEVRVVNFQIIGGSTQAPEEPATPEPTSPKPEPTIITPEEVVVMEVVAMFVSGLVEGDYAKVKSASTSSFLNTYPTENDFLKEINSPEAIEWRENFKEFEAKEVTIEGDKAKVEGIFYFERPTKDFPEAIDPSVQFKLVKEDGKWKVE